jgi:hypothetical protein
MHGCVNADAGGGGQLSLRPMSRQKWAIKGSLSLHFLLHLLAMQDYRLPLPTCANSPTYHHALPMFSGRPPTTTTINLTLSAVQSLPAPPPTSRKYRQMVKDITRKQYNPQFPQHRLLHIAYGRFAAMASHRKQLQQPPTSFQCRCGCGSGTRRLFCRRQAATHAHRGPPEADRGSKSSLPG